MKFISLAIGFRASHFVEDTCLANIAALIRARATDGFRVA